MTLDLNFSGGPKMKVSPHGTSRSPIGLWQLNGDLLDSSGNGFTLVKTAGTEFYVNLCPYSTMMGMYFDGATYLVYSPAGRPAVSVLDITGDITIEALVQVAGITPSSQYIVCYGGNAETANANTLYSMYFASTKKFSFYWEWGAGTDAGAASTVASIISGRIHHIAYTRTGTTIKFYVDGQLVDTKDGVHAAETGVAPTGKLYIGSVDSGANKLTDIVVASVALIGSCLTDAQVLADAQGCLPWLY